MAFYPLPMRATPLALCHTVYVMDLLDVNDINSVVFAMSMLILLYSLIFLYVLTSVLLSLISRHYLKNTTFVKAYTVLYQLGAGLFALPFIPLDSHPIRLTPLLVALFALAMVFWALTNMFYLASYKYEEASVLSPLWPLYNVIALIIGILFFRTRIDLASGVGFLLIIGACFLTGFYRTNFRPSRGVSIGLCSVFFEGIALGISIPVIRAFPIPIFNALGFCIPGLINLFFFLRPSLPELRQVLRERGWVLLVSTALVEVEYLAFYGALRIGTTPQVVSFGAASTFLIVVGGILILKERQNIPIKLLSASLATIGVILGQR